MTNNECPECGQALEELFDAEDEFMLFRCPSCGYEDYPDEDEDQE